MRRSRCDDRGQVTVWMLAFTSAVLLFSLGVTVETWRIVSAWRGIAATADAAAAAGASGIDEAEYRSSGGAVVRLDPQLAEELALRSLDEQQDRTEIANYEATATTEEITVVVHGNIDLLLVDALRGRPIVFTASATADPRPSP